jgi:23S rRNA (adenine2503-C2)-methyltransferase
MDLKNLDQPGLIGHIRSMGLPEYRGRQIFSWLYRMRVDDFEQMTDLPTDLRQRLAKEARVSSLLPLKIITSADGTRKIMFRLEDGPVIEAVLIPEENRYTLCVSTQAGCAMGCKFCRTASLGFIRNLSTAEMVNQVLASFRIINEDGSELPLSNLVFMGMGEPLANFDNLLTAINILKDQRGLDFSERRITVSTCGLLPKMKQLGLATKINLAVSLHAATNRVRDQLMPINKTYPLGDLLEALRSYPLPPRKRIMIEYILLAGINDSDRDAKQLASILHGIRCKINLLPYNETETGEFLRPSQKRIDAFQQILWNAGFTVIMRSSRGDDIGAACGQLAGKLQQKGELEQETMNGV